MIGGKKCKIDTKTFQNDMTSINSRDDVFTLFVHLGYLAYDRKSKSVFIPNEEVRSEFIRAVKEGRRPELAKAVKIRSEERRVGKECRYRWGRDREKKKERKTNAEEAKDKKESDSSGNRLGGA